MTHHKTIGGSAQRPPPCSHSLSLFMFCHLLQNMRYLLVVALVPPSNAMRVGFEKHWLLYWWGFPYSLWPLFPPCRLWVLQRVCLYTARSLLFLKCLTCESVSHSGVSHSSDPMDCSPSGSSVHGILQARILEWVVVPFPWRSSQPRDQSQVFCIAGRFFTFLYHGVISSFRGGYALGVVSH